MRLRRPLYPPLVLGCAVLALCPALAAPPAVSAALSFTVTTTADSPDANPGDGICANAAGRCSPRAAVQEANAQPRGAKVVITVPAGRYVLSLGALTARGDTVLISGAGSGVTQLIGQDDRVLKVASTARVAVAGVTIAGGNAGAGVGGGVANLGVLVISESAISNNVANNGGGLYNAQSAWLAVISSTITGNVVTSTGGGIVNGGTLSMKNSTLSSNTATSGGGIVNGGTLTLSDSSVSGNVANSGGGIVNVSGTLTVTNGTVSGNRVAGDGGGIYNDEGMVRVSNSTISGNSALYGSGGGVVNDGILSLRNSTIGGNMAGGYGGGIRNDGLARVSYSTLSGNRAGPAAGYGGIYNGIGTVTLTGTIVANTTGSPNCSGIISEVRGYNLDSDGSCGFTQSTDITDTDPLLGPLADNGGPTRTMALPPGSPAIDKGGTVANGCPATDQRGVSRPRGPACDIGAFERVP